MSPGEYSVPTAEQLEKTAACPSHNIANERLQGLTDHARRRAPNAKTPFIASKVKTVSNKTLPWLSRQSTEKQSKIINFSRSHQAKIAPALRQKDEDVKKVKLQQMAIKYQQRVNAHHGKVQRSLKEFAMPGAVAATSDQIQDLLKDCAVDENVRKNVDIDQCIMWLSNPKTVINKTFTHLLAVDGHEQLYTGRFVGLKPKKISAKTKHIHYEIHYTNGDVEKHLVESIISDFVFGTLEMD